MCRELAEKHGFDPEKAYLAGILHDVCKEESENELKRLAFTFDLDPLEQEVEKLLHAPAGAAYVKETLGIADEELLLAIRFHTVGRAGMSKLEKILYLGDLVEYSRDYPEIEKYREYVLCDLDLGMYEALKWSINDCLTGKKQISHNTLTAYNYYTILNRERLIHGK
jgi:predicted HD superfamily hydrolase involved in NAD metabolism